MTLLESINYVFDAIYSTPSGRRKWSNMTITERAKFLTRAAIYYSGGTIDESSLVSRSALKDFKDVIGSTSNHVPVSALSDAVMDRIPLGTDRDSTVLGLSVYLGCLSGWICGYYLSYTNEDPEGHVEAIETIAALALGDSIDWDIELKGHNVDQTLFEATLGIINGSEEVELDESWESRSVHDIFLASVSNFLKNKLKEKRVQNVH
jgi:hypothetical protein